MDTIEQVTANTVQKGMRVQKSFVSVTPYAPGRRSFFKYRDLGLEAATGGRMRAYQNSSIVGMTEPTGWHYHICEMQFVYVLKGELTIEFEDGTVGTFKAGDAFFVPGGIRDNWPRVICGVSVLFTTVHSSAVSSSMVWLMTLLRNCAPSMGCRLARMPG